MLSELPRSAIRKLLFFFSCWFIRQRDHDHVVRIKDKIRNSQVLDTGPSDSFDRLGVEKKTSPVVFKVHGFGKHKKRKAVLFSLSFPLTLLWTGFQTPCSFPNRIKSPGERKLKIKTVVVLSLCPVSTYDFQSHI